ncbi:MAG TPA: family 16 glycoside hydrolase [Vicinamibacterales bacterium]|jgi:mono/diheme cytochrome c family protein|nr:family 16 glycoside hydrolase [Vicinamibacterales bacterium]
MVVNARAFTCATLVAIGAFVAHAAVQGDRTSAGEPEAYYTDTQAARGQALFEKHCGSCHSAERDPARAKAPRLPGATNLGGSIIADKKNNGRRIWTTVYFLYREFESMPAVIDSISAQVRTDIIAYVLRQNGFPSGRAELRFDLAAMKLMPLDESGFVRLFNGKDLVGWKFLVGLGCAPPPQGCGRAEAGQAFAVRDGVLVGSGKEHGFMYTEGRYKNFTLRLDYLSEKPADWDADDIYYYANTGYHLFLMDENLFVWPKSMTLAGEQRDVLKPIPLGGTKLKASTWDNEARLRVVRPLGEWNSIEIQSKDGDLKAFLNDTLISTVTQHEYTQPGHIGIQMQGYPARWRNIRIREE